MKRIIFLLLLTVSVYGQNPSRFAKIQITGNANSGTATKVNVQEANGEVNTQTINTGFNKNIGLGGSDVVGANTLLNQYSTTPIEWTATAFNSGQVVFFVGKQWLAKIATVAGDVPAVSSKWEEITFEALSNKTTTVDQTIIDGSTNAVSGNAVFDGLATKFQTPTNLTSNYLPKWNGSGFGNSQLFDNGGNVGIGTNNPLQSNLVISPSIPNGTVQGLTIVYHPDGNGNRVKSKLWINDFNGQLDLTNSLDNNTISIKSSGASYFNGGRILINKTDDDLTNQLQVAGTISASPATTANQVVVKSQLDAAARPYKVYTALLTQTGTNAPTATVLENTLGGTVVWTRSVAGTYVATLTGAFTTSKTITFGTFGNVDNPSLNTLDFQQNSVNSIFLITRVSGTATDSVMDANTSIEIRIYP